MEWTTRINSKILSSDALVRNLNIWRFKNRKIVFTNGCFDLLHRGHIEYLAQAADLGDKLIVGINSDESVRRIKGEGRPIQDQFARAMAIASMEFVRAVVIFNEDTPYDLISLIQPDVLVKGGDYELDQIVGKDIVDAKNGLVKTIDLIPGYSTTSILNRL